MTLRSIKEINVKNLNFVIKFLWKLNPKWHVLNFILLIVQSIIPLINIYQIKLIFDSVTQALGRSTFDDAISSISWQITGIIVLALFNNILTSVATLLRAKHYQVISEELMALVHKKSIAVDLEYYENQNFHNTFYRVQTDAPDRIFRTFEQLQSIFQSSISLAAMMGMLMMFHWSYGILILLSVFPGIIVQFVFSKKRYHWQQETTEVQRKNFYFNWLLTGSYVAKEIRTLDLGELFMKKAKAIREVLFKEGYKITKTNTFWAVSTKAIELIIIYGVFFFLVLRTLRGSLSIGDLVMYYQISIRGQSNVSILLNGIGGLFIDNLFFKNLMEFLAFKPVVKDLEDPTPFPNNVYKIEFKNICFHYPDQDSLVLQNINFQLKRGDKIAIVGKNGSGKTTLIKLLCRLYNASLGGIYINGIDYSHFKVTDLRENISVLFQDYVNYQMKAGENIWLGDIKHTLNPEKIRTSALHSGADEFIKELPQQYESNLGKMFDKGEELSTGQWQKIALARTLIRNAQIVILDEPSSSIDAEAERNVIDKILELTENKILILVSHRLSTIKSATCIYFLEDGKIIENGSHDALIRLNGKYSAMFNQQHSDSMNKTVMRQ